MVFMNGIQQQLYDLGARVLVNLIASSRVAFISIPKALYSEEVVAGYQQQQPRGSESEIGVMKRKPRYCWACAAETPLQGIPRTVEAFWTLEIWIIYFLVD